MPKKKTAKKPKQSKKIEKAIELVMMEPRHDVECLKCGAITTIPRIGHNPAAKHMCIQCNALLDIFNNCKTCNQ